MPAAPRLGLLGGTFDPPHNGHLALAGLAKGQLALESVLFLPVGQPPHKPGRPISPACHRLAMLKLAIAGQPGFALDERDLTRRPPHTTVTLLPLLRQAYPQAEFWLLIGSDSLADLPTWHQPAEIISQCRLAVLPRPGFAPPWQSLIRALPGLEGRVDWLEGATTPVSASEIRVRVQQGRSIRHLVPAAVHDYILGHGLYASGSGLA